MNLIDNISSFITLNDQEKKLILSLFEKKTLKKKECFLEEGQVCNRVGFIEEGSVVYSRGTSEGDRTITDFAFQGEWITYYQSLLTRMPSDTEIMAHEKTVVQFLRRENLENLYELLPKAERLGRVLAEKSFVELSARTVNLQALSAEARYLDLITRKPKIIEKIPQHLIASYLGVKPQSLSRIRQNIKYK